jgi:protein-S-isoprenylcysteine O-methyltransferase Ste14
MAESSSANRRASYLAYAVAVYAFFFAVLVYSMGFIGNFWRTLGLEARCFRNMDFAVGDESTGVALVGDGLLIALFGVQHSVMARPRFKRWWTRVVPVPIERSTYVLAASVCLLLLVFGWRPIGTAVLWDFAAAPGATVLIAVSACGWLIVVLSTFMLDHFDLFGLRQAWDAFRQRDARPAYFATPAFYKLVRHPIYFGFIVAFWATPTMTVGHLVFALGMTAYILFAVRLEERDLVQSLGDAYRQYQREVSMLVPWPRR